MNATTQPLPQSSATSERPRNRLRWAWVPVMAVAIGWYFLGYLKSLDGYLTPVYERWPVLRDWVASIPI